MPAVQTFAPPLTKGGLRLHACQTLDGDVCKRPVANMYCQYCQQLVFARAAAFDTEKAKGPAETITAQQCTKKKCTVFEEIACAR